MSSHLSGPTRDRDEEGEEEVDMVDVGVVATDVGVPSASQAMTERRASQSVRRRGRGASDPLLAQPSKTVTRHRSEKIQYVEMLLVR